LNCPAVAIIAIRNAIASVSLIATLAGCTDAATRIANDIEAGAAKLRSSGATRLTVKHAPERSPEGCVKGYYLQLSERSIMVVWCAEGGSYGTTYHLSSVEVPQTHRITKQAGEPTLIELEKNDDRIVVTAVR
jgi:hypothetical protein